MKLDVLLCYLCWWITNISFTHFPAIIIIMQEVVGPALYSYKARLPAERWDILTALWLGSLLPPRHIPAERWDILTGCCRKMRHLDSSLAGLIIAPKATLFSHKATCRKMGHLDRLLPKDETPWQLSGWAHRCPSLLTQGYIPAERWDILTGCCRKMRHLDSSLHVSFNTLTHSCNLSSPLLVWYGRSPTHGP